MDTPIPSIAIQPEANGQTIQVSINPALYVKLVMVAMFWGGTFIAGRILVQSVPLMTAAFGRFLVAAVLLVLVAIKGVGFILHLVWLMEHQ